MALLADPARRVERPAQRQHLLTWGIGECGVCGGHLRVATKGRARAQLYVCEARADDWDNPEARRARVLAESTWARTHGWTYIELLRYRRAVRQRETREASDE